MLNRRSFMAGSAITAMLVATPWQAKSAHPLFASARKDQTGQNFAVIFSPKHGDIVSVKLPGRAHEITPHPLFTECVALGRSPSRSSIVFGPDRQPLWFHSKDDRHFLGHGVFSPDGRLFYTTENDYEKQRGVIGIRDVLDGYKQIGEFESFGIGAHQIALIDHGKTLVIANDGILTHPDLGRQKLNRDMMESSLVYLDAKSGKLLEKHSPPGALHKLSIRHLTVTPDGMVVFGMQYNGPQDEHPPLLGFHRRGEKIKLGKAPANVHKAMRNFIGAVAIDKAGTTVAASCPKGNMVTFWNISTRSLVSHSGDQQERIIPSSKNNGLYFFTDCSGVAANCETGGFMISSGLGNLGNYSVPNKIFVAAQSRPLQDYQWDNHISRFP